jgi:hypothetical protein
MNLGDRPQGVQTSVEGLLVLDVLHLLDQLADQLGHVSLQVASSLAHDAVEDDARASGSRDLAVEKATDCLGG